MKRLIVGTVGVVSLLACTVIVSVAVNQALGDAYTIAGWKFNDGSYAAKLRSEPIYMDSTGPKSGTLALFHYNPSRALELGFYEFGAAMTVQGSREFFSMNAPGFVVRSPDGEQAGFLGARDIQDLCGVKIAHTGPGGDAHIWVETLAPERGHDCGSVKFGPPPGH